MVVVMSGVHWRVMRRKLTILSGYLVPCGIPGPIGAVKGTGWHRSQERNGLQGWPYTLLRGLRYNIG
jgi:hypothetical protein